MTLDTGQNERAQRGEWNYLRYADRVLCGCEMLAREARKRVTEERRRRIEVLPLGVNMERFSSLSDSGKINKFDLPSKGEGARYVNVGSLVSVKDQATLLRAFIQVLGELPQAQLTIAGVGPLEGECADLLES